MFKNTLLDETCVCVCVSVCVCIYTHIYTYIYVCVCSVISNSLQPHGLYSPWNSPGQNNGVGGHSLLQGIFPTQGSNPGLPHFRQILYHLSHQGNPILRYRTHLLIENICIPVHVFCLLYKQKYTTAHVHTMLGVFLNTSVICPDCVSCPPKWCFKKGTTNCN